MIVVSLASTKGGSGKSVLAAKLALAASFQGARSVGLIDTCSQASLLYWWSSRSTIAPLSHMHHVSPGDDFLNALAILRKQGCDVVIVDTQRYTDISYVIDESSIVVIPVLPTIHDIESIGNSTSYLTAASKPFVIVVNDPVCAEMQQQVDELSTLGNVAPVVLHRTHDDPLEALSSFENDQTSGEARKILNLWTFLMGCLHPFGTTKQPTKPITLFPVELFGGS